MSGDNVVGSITGFLRLDSDQFDRKMDAAIAKTELLEHSDATVKVKADTNQAERALDRVEAKALGASGGVDKLGGSIMGIPAPVAIAGIGAAIALIGPVTGAATAATFGLAGAVGVAVLAYKGLKAEQAAGTATGNALSGALGQLKSDFNGLAAAAAAGAGGGVLSSLNQLHHFLPDLNNDVRKLGSELGNALSIGTGGLVKGLQVANPLLLDAGRYAGVLATKFANFTASGEFAQFIAYARAQLPLVVEAMGNLTEGLITLAVQAAPAGEELVKQINAIGVGLQKIGPALGWVSKVNEVTKWLNPVTALGKGWEKFQEISGQTKDSVETVTVSLRAQTPILDGQAKALGTTTAAMQAATAAQAKTADSANAATLQMQLENDAAGILKQSLDALNGEALSAAEAQNSFDSSLANMGDHVTAQGKQIHFTTTSIKDMSAASVALRGQLNSQVANLQRVVEANGGLADSTGKARGQMITMRKQIIDNAVAHGVDRKAVTAYVDQLLKIPKKVPPTKLDVDKAAASKKLAALQKQIDNLHSKTLTISVITGTARKLAANPGLHEANGGVLNAYAGGGFENHVAQIAPAGAMRLWAEPETGGEAYIPLAPSKRARSTAIWEETGRKLGVGGGGPVHLSDASIDALARAMSRRPVVAQVVAGSVEQGLMAGAR